MMSRSLCARNALSGKPVRLTVEDSRIRTIEAASSCSDTWVSPGLIDLQVNGFAGCDLNDEGVDPDLVVALVRKLAAAGTTTFLPTIITSSEQRIVRALRAIAKARQTSALAARVIPFVHVEGPHISPEDEARGAHRREYVRPPDLAEFERWQQASQNLVGMVTLSPHWENAVDYIAALRAKKVLVAIGHTDASPAQIHAAADAGAMFSTHLGNGVARLLPRHPNLLWAQLSDDRLNATFIADGHHLPDDPLRAMLRAKGIDRSILISDSVALAGMPPGIYDSPIGGRVELREDGRLSMAGTDFLAGSACSLSQSVARLATGSLCASQDAFRMATENPGRFAGGRGTLRPGSEADLILFTLDREKRTMQIETTLILGGERMDSEFVRTE